MIEITGLTKHFGPFTALDDLNLHVQNASVYGLVGPNGAGKTTLIKHLTGVFRQDSGTVLIKGEPVFENTQIKSSMVYIPDDLYFFSQYSIRDAAKLYASVYPNWNSERYEALKQVFPLDETKSIARLSKGMQRQAAFWLGISTMPQIMILDEPVDGLDPIMRRKVWNLILQDVAQRGTTVLVSSHNLRELEDVVDHVGILHNGKIVIERELDDVKSDLHKLQVAFQGEIPREALDIEGILHQEQIGSILSLIVRGKREDILPKIQATQPVILDVLPLTLEEIFIYELGGMDYDIKSILI